MCRSPIDSYLFQILRHLSGSRLPTPPYVPSTLPSGSNFFALTLLRSSFNLSVPSGAAGLEIAVFLLSGVTCHGTRHKMPLVMSYCV